jgi:hypothetical protein
VSEFSFGNERNDAFSGTAGKSWQWHIGNYP